VAISAEKEPGDSGKSREMTHRKSRRIWLLAGLGVMTLALAACSTESGPKNRQNSLRPKGKYAHQIDNLFTPVFWVAVVVGIFIIGAVIFIAIRFRARPGHDDRPKQIHGSTPLEIGWTIVPAIILLVVGGFTVRTIFSLDQTPRDPLRVTVVAKQWWWQFEYPNAGGGKKKVVVADELRIPTGRDVELSLKACDTSLPGGANGGPGCNVIHSFWVPELAGTRDVVPGRTNYMKIRAGSPGTFLGQCKEYCGLSHANMRFRVIAQSPGDFDTWLAGQRAGPVVKLANAGRADALFNEKFSCSSCHTTGDSSLSTYGPNLTHLASRSTFASGYYKLTRAKLIEWILDAPSLIPMQSELCRLPPPATCVGMPSFTKNTPKVKGQSYPVMTRAEAGQLADYLLSLK
jgi:cytochrome c oxidase subunit 2